MSEYKVNGVAYRQKFRKCGKPGCRCREGQGHGPYWYAFSDAGALKYVGLVLPTEITDHVARLKAGKAKIKKIRDELEKRSAHHLNEHRKLETQLRNLRALEAGEYTASAVLVEIGLGEFNGHH
jgi:hypothetical protein